MKAEWRKPVYAVFLIIIASLIYMYIGTERSITGMAVENGNSMQKITGAVTDDQIRTALSNMKPGESKIIVSGENFGVKALVNGNYQVTDSKDKVIGVYEVKTTGNPGAGSTATGPSPEATAGQQPQQSQSSSSSISTVPYHPIVTPAGASTIYMTEEDINYYIANQNNIGLAVTNNGYELYNKKSNLPYKKVEYAPNDDKAHIGRIYENYKQNPLSSNMNDAVPTVTRDGSGKTIATATVTQDSVTTIEYQGSNIVTDTITKADGKFTKTTYTEKCSNNGPCVTTSQVYEGTALSNLQRTGDQVTIDKESDIADRRATMTSISSSVNEDYGLSNIQLAPDGSTTYQGSGYTVSVSPGNNGAKDNIAITVNGKVFTYKEKEGFFGSDRFYVGDKRYTLSDSCGGSMDYCMKSGDEKVQLTEQEYKAFTEAGKFSDTSAKYYYAKYGHSRPDVQKRIDIYYNQIEAKTRSKITQILNAYISDILGPFSYGVPAGICGDRMYKTETTYKNKISGIPVPTSSYQSQMERDILEDLRTVIVFGKVTTLTDDMYRYEVTLKLIGDENTGQWELYLYNSCDKTDSKDFWKEYGTIGNKAVFEMMYAGQEGEDMVFECGVDKYCKFDQACLKLDDEAGPRCFGLAGALDKPDLCH